MTYPSEPVINSVDGLTTSGSYVVPISVSKAADLIAAAMRRNTAFVIASENSRSLTVRRRTNFAFRAVRMDLTFEEYGPTSTVIRAKSRPLMAGFVSGSRFSSGETSVRQLFKLISEQLDLSRS